MPKTQTPKTQVTVYMRTAEKVVDPKKEDPSKIETIPYSAWQTRLHAAEIKEKKVTVLKGTATRVDPTKTKKPTEIIFYSAWKSRNRLQNSKSKFVWIDEKTYQRVDPEKLPEDVVPAQIKKMPQREYINLKKHIKKPVLIIKNPTNSPKSDHPPSVELINANAFSGRKWRAKKEKVFVATIKGVLTEVDPKNPPRGVKPEDITEMLRSTFHRNRSRDQSKLKKVLIDQSTLEKVDPKHLPKGKTKKDFTEMTQFEFDKIKNQIIRNLKNNELVEIEDKFGEKQFIKRGAYDSRERRAKDKNKKILVNPDFSKAKLFSDGNSEDLREMSAYELNIQRNLKRAREKVLYNTKTLEKVATDNVLKEEIQETSNSKLYHLRHAQNKVWIRTDTHEEVDPNNLPSDVEQSQIK